eukprot:TRINITY_DN46064_c0_g1_i1.p1 TRINITY_DN46064_c0_g1~~TRINITY_DN46064_c0_g1_i1.p1  ORF type:complete len:301 (+),score=44.45 TRINITY_DN46064_c0_g1_i1:75-977(+)
MLRLLPSRAARFQQLPAAAAVNVAGSLCSTRGRTRQFATNPMFDLSGRTAVVTGGARDIGGACSVELARAGADVVVNYHASESTAATTVKEIEALGRRSVAVKADVFQQAGIDRLEAEASKFAALGASGGIDILVCCAGGLNVRGEITDMDEATIMENFQMNYMSTLLACRTIIPGMVERGFGRVILMGSIAGNNGGSSSSTPHYGPAKAAVHCLGRSLTQAYSKYGVNVNTIAPGVIDNGFHAKHTTPENMQKMVDRIPQGRPGRNEEVGAVAAFLASPAASHVCGDVIHVNGGMLFGS